MITDNKILILFVESILKKVHPNCIISVEIDHCHQCSFSEMSVGHVRYNIDSILFLINLENSKFKYVNPQNNNFVYINIEDPTCHDVLVQYFKSKSLCQVHK